MAASQGSLLSQTLQDITTTKLDDLANYRNAFESCRSEVLVQVKQEKDVLRALTVLAEGVKKCFTVNMVHGRVTAGATGYSRLEVDLQNLDRFLAQARYDPSVSHKILEQWHQTLMKHLNVQSLKYSFASLYGQLTNEWLTQNKAALPAPSGDDMETDDFEHVQGGKKMESRLNWERSVFEPAQVDPAAITSLLQALFEPGGEQHAYLRDAVTRLRAKVQGFELKLASTPNFSKTSLKWVIAGLEASDLLTDEKRAVLRDIKDNSTFLNEIADVLNMRLTALSSWSWGTEVPLEQRRQVNGSFRVFMHEDLLQAIFLQYIGVRWSVFWKTALRDLLNEHGVWQSACPTLSPEEQARFQAQIGTTRPQNSVQWYREDLYKNDFFLAQLHSSHWRTASGGEGEEEADFEMADITHSARTKQTAGLYGSVFRGPVQPDLRIARQRLPGGGRGGLSASRIPPRERPLKKKRRMDSTDDASDDDDNDAHKSPMERRQNLLHLLATDVQIKTRYRGEITCLRSQIEDLYPSLPHMTIEKVLSFFGVSKRWLDFFIKFLRAPLRFVDNKDSNPRARMKGTPGAHVLSEVFCELTLFCLDFQVNKTTNGEILWRVDDDLWFWSHDHGACVELWSGIQSFAQTMGISINPHRTASVRMSKSVDGSNLAKFSALQSDPALPGGQIRWGMLILDPSSGRWEIDQQMVDKHIAELSRQLSDKSGSLFTWTQAWNAYASTFFTSNFGPPAVCFGRQHVDSMLATHQRIQREMFSATGGADGGSVTKFLKQTIEQRFGVTDVPDAYVFLPKELGGLEVHSPFIGLLQIRDTLPEDPTKQFAAFEEAERGEYREQKTSYELRIQQPTQGLLRGGQTRELDAPFMSFEEFTRHREGLSYGYKNELADVFVELLRRPEEESLNCDENSGVMAALAALGDGNSRGILPNWAEMEPYWKWVAQLYGPEMIEQFGGFRIVDPGWLPMGMVSQFRSGRVKWHD